MPTNTTNLNLKKPIVGADEDLWGGYINDNLDDLDDYLSGTTAIPALNVAGSFTSLGIDDNATSTAMTLDASGNVLVGTTSSSNTTEGLRLKADYSIAGARDGAGILYLNRLTSDGEIARFQKDGSTVGSIAAKSGEMYLGSANTGLRFYDAGDAITPFDVTVATGRDNAIDIGVNTARFKDLYLAGGVYLGGTGSANKLDDYEIGTFSSSTSSNNLTSYGTFTGRYIKVGAMVHLTGKLSGITAGTGYRYFAFFAPFPQYAASNISMGVSTNYSSGDRQSGFVINNSSTESYGFYVGWNNVGSQSGGGTTFSITYESPA